MTYKAMKIKVETPEKSEAVQEALFKLGYMWRGDSTAYVQLTYKQALFADEDGKITYMTEADTFFNNHHAPEYVEMHGQLVLAIETKLVPLPATVTYKPIDVPMAVPLGLKPKAIHDKMRMLEVLEAIHRYVKADKKFPYDWHEEYRELAQQFVAE